MKPDLYGQVGVRVSLAPDTYADDNTFNGAAVDMMESGQRFTSAMAVVVHGPITSTYNGAVKLQESANGASWTDVAAGKLTTTFLSVTSAQAEKVRVVGYKGTARYLRLVLTAQAAEDQTAFVTGLLLVGDGGRVPLTQNPS